VRLEALVTVATETLRTVATVGVAHGAGGGLRVFPVDVSLAFAGFCDRGVNVSGGAGEAGVDVKHDVLLDLSCVLELSARPAGVNGVPPSYQGATISYRLFVTGATYPAGLTREASHVLEENARDFSKRSFSAVLPAVSQLPAHSAGAETALGSVPLAFEVVLLHLALPDVVG
jgi:hypothetical protein